jgi:hypothetical protein
LEVATTEVSIRPQQQDVERVFQLGTGLIFTAALQPIVRLRIPDLLANGPVTVSELAAQAHVKADPLYRVLRVLACVGVVQELPERAFAPTSTSELLRSDVPGSMRNMVLWMSNPFHFKVWAELGYSIETGKPGVERAYGKSGFDAIFGDPEIACDFNNAMSCISRMIAPALLEAYDFSRIDTLMDIAGGHGAVLCEVLSRYPNMKGILFDMPNVIQEANCHICNLKMDDRCQTISGDFFENIPAGADAYYMQHIIHDWDDEPALKILGNCRRALEGRSHGVLLIVDSVVPQNSELHTGKWLDLEMLLIPGGRERTEPEWHALMNKSGFDITRIIPMRASESVIEAKLKS